MAPIDFALFYNPVIQWNNNVPSYSLKQYWLVVKRILANKFHWNLNQNKKIVLQ